MREASGPLWADRAFLRDIQYADDRNLAARQSIYAYCEHKADLPALVIGSLDLGGHEVVADVGCGNGLYLAELASHGHRAPAAGVDLSPGMLRAACLRAPAARLAAGDAAELPLRDRASDVTLAMHMLYHVPEPTEAVGELRRVTRPGGTVEIGLNADDHLSELRALVNAELGAAGLPARHVVRERITLDEAEVMLAGVFGSVVRHDLTGHHAHRLAGLHLSLPQARPVDPGIRRIGCPTGE
ncbi:MAG TPA: class I SAM-dependent methyltransferase [Streptosporangiaceae bacterium]|nr:class I SAM-dependent methyltransferase [Streptosporangiaceae bacterium]